MHNLHCIYKISNVVNRKFYIGSTYDFGYRKKAHLRQLKRGSHHCAHLQYSWNKYGSENFVFEVVEILIFPVSLSKEKIREHLLSRELHYIKTLNPIYNVCRETSGGLLGRKQTSETISKIRARSNMPDNKLRIRKIQKLAAAKLKGKKRPYKELLAMGNGRSAFGGRFIEISDMEGSLISACRFVWEASEITGISPSSIKNNLYNLSKTTRGYTFKFKEVSHR